MAYPASDFPDPASALVDLERREQFAEEGAHFGSAYFLRLLWIPPVEGAARADGWLDERRATKGVDPQALLVRFIDRSDWVLHPIDGFVPLTPQPQRLILGHHFEYFRHAPFCRPAGWA